MMKTCNPLPPARHYTMTDVKPLLRFLRACLTFLSLILFVATLLLWFSRTRSYEFYFYDDPLSYQGIWSFQGRIYIVNWSAPKPFWGERSMSTHIGRLTRLQYSVGTSRQFGP